MNPPTEDLDQITSALDGWQPKPGFRKRLNRWWQKRKPGVVSALRAIGGGIAFIVIVGGGGVAIAFAVENEEARHQAKVEGRCAFLFADAQSHADSVAVLQAEPRCWEVVLDGARD